MFIHLIHFMDTSPDQIYYILMTLKSSFIFVTPVLSLSLQVYLCHISKLVTLSFTLQGCGET